MPWLPQHPTPEADYLEVEWELSQGCRIQRQFLLAKEDSFAFFADTILPNKPGKIEYAGVWPLANGLSYRPRAETTDGQIMHGETPIAQVIPLPLAEWRSERSIGGRRQGFLPQVLRAEQCDARGRG